MIIPSHQITFYAPLCLLPLCLSQKGWHGTTLEFFCSTKICLLKLFFVYICYYNTLILNKKEHYYYSDSIKTF